jgi:2-dehydropantoate 2-reductase
MGDDMQVMCLGAGAIGGYYGGRLIEGGQPVTFLVRERRKQQILADGIRIESQFGDFAGPARAITPDEIAGSADLVILTCKAYDLPSAIDTIRPAVGPDTAVLPLLNGIAHMATLNAAFGPRRVLGGLAKIAATLTPEGVVKHLNDWRYITFGEQDGTDSDRVRALKTAFDRTSVVAKSVPDVMQEMWNKVVHLSTVAGMTTVMRASVGEIAQTPEGTALFLELLESNAAIASREGFAPSEAFLDEYRTLFRNKTSGYTASMLRDLEKRGPIEADHIIGFMRDKAREHGLDERLHRIILTHLKAYEVRRAANRF